MDDSHQEMTRLSDLAARQSAELAQERDIRQSREIAISLMADSLGVEAEPHQTFFERLLDATRAASRPAAKDACPECGEHALIWQLGVRNSGGAVDGRIRLNEVTPLLIQSCEFCSETVRVLTDSDDLSEALTVGEKE